MSIDLEPSWLHILKDEFEKDYMIKLRQFLKQEKNAGYKIYPKGSDIFLEPLKGQSLVEETDVGRTGLEHFP